jgi:D-sedoheptulose 7-phosphate isomerase
MHGCADDLLFAISSSGESEDILLGVDMGISAGMNVITLSGFKDKNSLRGRGVVNFYVPSTRYGLVEVAHFAILHHILDRVIADAGT